VGPGSRVLEVGAGLGSLTLALAETGADVVAVEVDRSLLPALQEVLAGRDNVRIKHADALTADWGVLLPDPGPWILVANLPYNVAVLVVLGLLEREPRVERQLVMVQREVGERLVAPPGGSAFGAVTLRVAYRAHAEVLRRVPPSVFWPRPGVDSVLVRLTRRPPPVSVVEGDLWRVIDEAFAQRRKTMRNALVRLGLGHDEAVAALEACGVDPSTRPERLGLEAFACLAERVARALASGSAQADEPR
jgi:16S rRNA (adenine1518-N6/adenine1519-N6)-dimethyltransferase